MVQRVLEMILDLTLGTMSVKGREYPKVTKLGSSSHTTYYSLSMKSVAVAELLNCANYK